MADLTALVTTATQAIVAADGAPEGIKLGALGAGLAAGLAVIGAGYAIGKLSAAALEGTARQPEAAATLKGTMILAIAFIEALALIAMVVGFVIAGK
jgi:F-type H+-transporting ATPase subunit c